MKTAQKVLNSRYAKVLGLSAVAFVAGSLGFAQFEIGSIGTEAAGVVADAGTAATAYVPVAIALTLGIRWAFKIFG